MIDLHSHTSASDGQYAPSEQVARAAEAGVTILGVTDHDTVRGLEEARQTASGLGLRLVDGIELTCTLHRREVHVLGHFIDPTNPTLVAHLSRVETARDRRMADMVERLNAMGVPVRLEHVHRIAAGATLTRPHLARALVELRICSSVKEAFDRFLGDGKPAVVARFDTTPEQAIGLIHAAGGTATLAHPGSSKVHKLELELLAGWGLDGLEVLHREHPPSQQALFTTWARALSLCVTGGSDFHGPAVAPDRLFGSISMALGDFERLEARAARGSDSYRGRLLS